MKHKFDRYKSDYIYIYIYIGVQKMISIFWIIDSWINDLKN